MLDKLISKEIWDSPPYLEKLYSNQTFNGTVTGSEEGTKSFPKS